MTNSQTMFTPLPPAPAPNRLAGKTALITGAAGSIGASTALRFLAEGARVSLIDNNPAALSSTAKALAEELPTGKDAKDWILEIVADVTEEGDVMRYVRETVEWAGSLKGDGAKGTLDCAFLNAGISSAATSLFDVSVESFEKVMRVNVLSAFLGLKHVSLAMRGQPHGGSIILTSSIAGLRGTPGLILYSGSKFALRGFSLTAAAELGQYGIRVNTVHPSGVNTPMFRATWSPQKMEELSNNMPLGRFAEPEDVAAVASFLASDDSGFLTGGMLKVDGGCVSF